MQGGGYLVSKAKMIKASQVVLVHTFNPSTQEAEAGRSL